ncbi:hypothetical protein [Aromatoleum evansii]|uniref:hypothetical protein n=1 Tax=Aromatoleum evansii TaxID=59406 RepID=UPI00145DEBDA|nr:hypothetical protein [Aromatoleum evansii]NMG32311.1 hypothetical protein [Aromatoleum evansii]
MDVVQCQRDELSAIQQELGGIRQAFGAAEGSLNKMNEVAGLHLAQTDAMRGQLSQRTTEFALLRRELELRDEKIRTMAQQMLPAPEPGDARPSAKPKARKRKPSSPVAASGAVTTTPPPKAR